MSTALDADKTIFVFLTTLQRVSFNPVQQLELGRTPTGFSNYSALPTDLGVITPRGGREIRPGRDLGVLADYWREFGKHSAYEIYLDQDDLEPYLVTKTGNKVIGSVIRFEKGAIVLLPPLDIPTDYAKYGTASFRQYDEEGENEYWTEEAIAFGHRLLGQFVRIDEALRNESSDTPPPEWALGDEYAMSIEPVLRGQIEELDERIAGLEAEREQRDRELAEAGALRRLVYEADKPLEAVIIRALRLMGFDAHPYQDAESEFDAVLTSPEGRFLGEAEGKDRRAVNVDKLSQLIRNLGEDLKREEMTEPARGILLGNGFRLEPPETRAETFTAKCISSAKLHNIALVRTIDLFPVARYLHEHEDSLFAEQCRLAIAQTSGVVTLPPIPN